MEPPAHVCEASTVEMLVSGERLVNLRMVDQSAVRHLGAMLGRGPPT
ncbi:MAG: hypothetical protein OXE81_01430 [Gammaproteobacteria bacterium]|nr:hypothetical protein [Gammaproteobacteria bacterium]